jgi:hypothetical protein
MRLFNACPRWDFVLASTALGQSDRWRLRLFLGTLYSKGDIKWLTRFDEGVNKQVPVTRENIAAFRDLMLK